MEKEQNWREQTSSEVLEQRREDTMEKLYGNIEERHRFERDPGRRARRAVWSVARGGE